MDDSFYRELLDNLYDGIFFVDKDRMITYWNKGAERLTGYCKDEVVGRYCHDGPLSHVDARGTQLCDAGCPLMETLRDGKPKEVDVFLHHKNGHRVPVSVRSSSIKRPDGATIGAVEVFSDNSAKISSQRRILELEQLALLDELTKFGNRRYLEMSLKSKLAETSRYNTHIAVFFIDIDHFKEINDNHGHDVGDDVLKVLAQTLSAVIRPMDLLGRWGGEEFVAASANVDKSAIMDIAERFRLLVERSCVHVGEEKVCFTISIGATLAKRNEDLDSVIKRADRLMYRSKKAGRNRVTVG